MWYNRDPLIISSSNSHLRCSQCGSRLIFVGKKVTRDSFSKVVITTYRCSDKSCQEDIDKKTKARIKLQKEQDFAKQKRIKIKMRLNKRKILR